MDTLYVTDLDYTLARRNKTLSNFTKNAIRRLYKERVMFTIATARSIKTMAPIVKGIKLHLPIIEFNGGMVSNLETHEHLIRNILQNDLVREIWELGERENLPPLISSVGKSDKVYFPDLNGKRMAGIQNYVSSQKQVSDPRLTPMIPLEEIEDEVLAMTFIGHREDVQVIRDQVAIKLQDKVTFHYYQNNYNPEWYWLSVHSPKSTKENAIRQLVEAENLHNYELVVFGDGANDHGMFKYADRAFAVSNALESLKSIATGVIGHHEDDSVMKFVMDDLGMSFLG